GGDQRRGQYQRIAHGAEHKILPEKGGLEGAGAAQTRRTVDRGEVDAGGEPDAADVDDVGRALQRMHGIGEDGFERDGALEQALLAIKVESRRSGGNAERVARIGEAMGKL